MTSILLVEDDPGIVRSVTNSLKFEGYEVTSVGTLAAARLALKNQSFDLLLLDVNLPDGTGYELCAEIRAEEMPLPIVMMTARSDESSALKGLRGGADDYLRKPIGAEELIVRLSKHLKDHKGRLKQGELVLDLDHHTAKFRDQELGLTPREFDILHQLLRMKGAVLSKEVLLRNIDAEGNMQDKTLESHVSRLRTKLKKAAGDAVDVSPLYGVGYRLETK